jgi:hypothetical protein
MFKSIKDNESIIDSLFDRLKNGERNLTESEWLHLVKYCGLFIKIIKKPTEEMKLEAVKSWGYSIEYIENPTEEMKMEAIKCCGPAIKYIKDPSEEMQLEALNKDWLLILDIENPSEKLKQKALDAIRNNVLKITSIKMFKQFARFDQDVKEFLKNNPDFERELISICEENLDYYNKLSRI